MAKNRVKSNIGEIIKIIVIGIVVIIIGFYAYLFFTRNV